MRMPCTQTHSVGQGSGMGGNQIEHESKKFVQNSDASQLVSGDSGARHGPYSTRYRDATVERVSR